MRASRRTSAASGRGTRTRSRSSRRCTRSPTGWAAIAEARSPPSWRSKRSSNGSAPGQGSLADQVQAANRAVYERSATDRKVTGMGTTLTAATVAGDRAHLVHVGDSRAYLLRAGALRQLTEDHTLVNRMLKAGEITEREAAVHPHRNVILRALGQDPDVAIDEQDVGLIEGDRLLLCSDGLTVMVPEDQLQAILEATAGAPQEAAERLVRAANGAGGIDNITVVVLDVLEGDPPATGDAERRRFGAHRHRRDGRGGGRGVGDRPAALVPMGGDRGRRGARDRRRPHRPARVARHAVVRRGLGRTRRDLPGDPGGSVRVRAVARHRADRHLGRRGDGAPLVRGARAGHQREQPRGCGRPRGADPEGPARRAARRPPDPAAGRPHERRRRAGARPGTPPPPERPRPADRGDRGLARRVRAAGARAARGAPDQHGDLRRRVRGGGRRRLVRDPPDGAGTPTRSSIRSRSCWAGWARRCSTG